MRFKLIQGKHAQKEDGPVDEKTGKPSRVVKIYKPGDIVEHASDLAARFNTPPAGIKFEKLDGPATTKAKAPSQPAQTLTANVPPPRNEKEYHAAIDKMNLQELKNHAAEEEVDLKGETDVAKIRKLLKDI